MAQRAAVMQRRAALEASARPLEGVRRAEQSVLQRSGSATLHVSSSTSVPAACGRSGDVGVTHDIVYQAELVKRGRQEASVGEMRVREVRD